MKNIRQIISELNIELEEDQLKELEKAVNDNYKTVADYDRISDKLEASDKKYKETKEAFDDFKKDFDGVDVEELKQKASDLELKIQTITQDYENKLTQKELEGIFSDEAQKLNCLDVDLARSQVDFASLLKSKDRKADIESALKELKKNKPILFKEEKKEPTKPPKPNFTVLGGMGGDGDKPAPSLKNALYDYYKGE